MLAGREPDEAGDEDSRSPEDYLFTYLACLDPDRSGLPEHFLSQLRRTLARYGAQTLRRTPELEQALVRIYRSVTRVQRAAPVIMAILSRWLARSGTVTAPITDERLTVLDAEKLRVPPHHPHYPFGARPRGNSLKERFPHCVEIN